MNIVLMEPEIPHNTGAIGRTCLVTDSKLHLIKPFGFSIDDKSLKRAGLDYWNDIDVTYYENFEDFVSKHGDKKIYLATTKAKKRYDEVSYEPDSFIMFGRESTGIPEEILLDYEKTCVRIPMFKDYRSINLSVSAGIILFEALRQNNFPNLKTEGNLHRNTWRNS